MLFQQIFAYFPGQLFTLGNPEDVPAEDFVSDQDVVRQTKKCTPPPPPTVGQMKYFMQTHKC